MNCFIDNGDGNGINYSQRGGMIMAEENEKQGTDEKQEVTEKLEVSGKKKMDEKQERTWAMLCHLGAFAGFILPAFGNIIGPLVFWLIKRDESDLVDDQGKESLNFQISMAIYFIGAGILTLVVIGFVLLVGLGIFFIVMVIMASVKANSGERFRYPLTIRFIK